MAHREVIALDIGQIDTQIQATINQQSAVERTLNVKEPYQLVSRTFQQENSSIVIGDGHDCSPVTVGGTTASPVIIAGPCSVENREQMRLAAQAVKEAGGQILRGGAFKPRTSPYQFQGLGIEGLHILAEARQETGLPIITEVMEPAMVEITAQYADILQIGARNMQNYPLLRAVGKQSQQRPVLLKRGIAATIDEWLLAAEYIVASGNPRVILCERGIRSYDTHTRNLLDLTCIPLLQELSHLPILVDPSHGTGRREFVPTMSRASIAAGAAGLIIEVHPDPDHALSDGQQTITPAQLRKIVYEARAIAHMIREETLLPVA
jgi:3-deoxy-7-phosphoheptulonate synthase